MMQITSAGVQLTSAPNAPVYSWVQTTRFFILGIFYASVYALIPVAVVLWHNYRNYDDPTDWSLVWQMIVAAIGPVALSYWREHKALLKIPPWFEIPPEFRPTLKQTEHSIQTITPATVDAPKTIETVTEKHVEIVPPQSPDGT